jgi:hypothetical protein
LVDVDGVISLFGFDPSAPPPGAWELVDGIPHLISAVAGDHLRRLAGEFELVWCTGWEDRAEEHLPRALGLPRGASHIRFEPGDRTVQAHWKLAGIDAYAEPDRPVAWIDDALDERCHRWARERSGPTLLISTNPAVGLTEAHVEELLAWAAELGGSDAGAVQPSNAP